MGDTFAAASRGADAKGQYELVEAIDRLYTASGVNTDLQMALFLADHGRASESVERARAALEYRPDIFAEDALAWALYRDGSYKEALLHSKRALRLGTKNALLLFHHGMILHRLGLLEEASEFLKMALATNPYFSPLYADEALRTIELIRRPSV